MEFMSLSVLQFWGPGPPFNGLLPRNPLLNFLVLTMEIFLFNAGFFTIAPLEGNTWYNVFRPPLTVDQNVISCLCAVQFMQHARLYAEIEICTISLRCKHLHTETNFEHWNILRPNMVPSDLGAEVFSGESR